jgi:fructan beta-fructosidase
MRPVYHYTPAANWLSDPNGLVHAGGLWHLFYQYNPLHDQWGHMAWGHATSADLVEWAEQPPALLEDSEHLIFSGSAVVDGADCGGFGSSAIVALYTGAAQAGGRQVQCLASSVDNGNTWAKFAGNPVLDRNLADFRDPNVFWHAASARWIMVVALSMENRALVLVSATLRDWHEVSTIGPFDWPGRVWECPLLIELPIEGGGTRWLFKVDLLHDGPGSGAVGITGTFDGELFAADCRADGSAAWHTIDGGRDFYAAIAWHEPRDRQGRPCWIGWMGNHGYQAALPSRGWRGMMSLPRRISLRRHDGMLRLVQMVEPAQAASAGPETCHSGTVAGVMISTASRIAISGIGTAAVTLRLRQPGRELVLQMADGRLRLDRSAGFSAAFDTPIDTDLAAGDGVVIWLDHGCMEIESAGGAGWISVQHDLMQTTTMLAIDGPEAVEIVVATMGRSLLTR